MPIVTRIQEQVGGLAERIRNARLLDPALGPILAALFTLLLLVPVTRIVIEHNLPLAISSPDDVRAHMSLRLAAGSDGRPAIYNLGGSSLLRAIADEPEVEHALGDRFEVFNLMTPSQSNIESRILLQQVDLKAGDLVILHVNISRLNNLRPEKHWICNPYFYTVNTEDVVAAIEAFGLDPGINPLCHVTWLSRRAVLKAIAENALDLIQGNGLPVFQGIYPMKLDRDDKALEAMRSRRLADQRSEAFAESWLRLDPDLAEDNVGLVLEMHRYVTGKGAHFVLLDLPMNRDWFERYHGQWFAFDEAYRRALQPVLEQGVDYRDLRGHSGFDFSDYYDHTHMIEKGRKKFFPIYEGIVAGKLGRGTGS